MKLIESYFVAGLSPPQKKMCLNDLANQKLRSGQVRSKIKTCVCALTCAPLALQIFHHLLGRGGVFNYPRLSRLLLVIEKNGKSVRKLVKNDYETVSVNFSLQSKLRPPEPKNCQIFEFFAIVKHHFGKPPLSQELL